MCRIFAFGCNWYYRSCNRLPEKNKGIAANYPSGNLDFVAPAGAGGGWDLTIRTVAKVLGDTGIVNVPMPVRNAPGAGGAFHLASLQAKKK